jgi:hypothetical protein
MQRTYSIKTGLLIGLIILTGVVLAIMLASEPVQSAPLAPIQPVAALPFGAATRGTPAPAANHQVPNGSANGTCASPLPIACGQQVNGDTSTYHSNYDTYSCGEWSESGPEVIYQFTLPAGNTYDVTASLSNLQLQDLDIFLLSNCSASTCLGTSTSGDLSASASNISAGTYYIAVDGYQGAMGSYTLDLNCTPQGKSISKLYLPLLLKEPKSTQPPTNTPTPTATATTPAPGDTATDFINNTSYAIVALQVDGVEQFPTSPLGILPGDSYRMDLTAGQHTYFAQNGYWESDGTRAPFYQWQGTFEQQANIVGAVAFTDPTIEQLLTEFGTSKYWQGEYWAGTDLHYAGFCYYSDSTFIFYIDGGQNDTGTYSLLSRQPGIFTVNFRVTNTAGTEYFDGAFKEINGNFMMQNGPPGWELIDYYPSSSVNCP